MTTSAATCEYRLGSGAISCESTEGVRLYVLYRNNQAVYMAHLCTEHAERESTKRGNGHLIAQR